MARTKLKPVSVYMEEEQHAILTAAAKFENRSLSNFLLTYGLQKAEEIGFNKRTVKGLPAEKGKKRK